MELVPMLFSRRKSVPLLENQTAAFVCRWHPHANVDFSKREICVIPWAHAQLVCWHSPSK